jgi:hypothetical protein
LAAKQCLKCSRRKHERVQDTPKQMADKNKRLAPTRRVWVSIIAAATAFAWYQLYSSNLCFRQLRYLSHDELCRGGYVAAHGPYKPLFSYEDFMLRKTCKIEAKAGSYKVIFARLGYSESWLLSGLFVDACAKAYDTQLIRSQ